MSGEETLSQRLARQARDLVEAAGSKTGQLARVGRLQLDLLGLKREIQRELKGLGERALELARLGGAVTIADDPVAEPILRRIEQLEADKLQREEQIRELNEKVPDEEETT